MKASSLATPLARLALFLSTSTGVGTIVAQPYTPPAGAGLSAYPPGAVQPPAYQMPVAPRPPTPPPGPPPAGFQVPVYRPPTIQAPPGTRLSPAPTKKPAATKSKGTTTKSNYRPSAGGSSSSKAKSSTPSSLESRVGKLESNDHRQDLRLGRIERDVGLLPNSVEGGGMADIVPTGKTHIVRPGDTLFSVASRYGTSVGELHSLNRLTDDTLDIGETLLIPDGQTWTAKATNTTVMHVVDGDQSLASIARTYGVTEDAIARANPSAYASDLRDGERLIIPNPKRMPGTSTPRRSGGATTSIVSSNVTHTVKKGEMLGRIASKHGVSLSKIMAANGIKNPDKVIIGQRLIIPGKKATRTIPDPVRQDQETTPLPSLRLVEADREPAAIAPLKPMAPVAPLPPIKPASPEPEMQRGIVAYRMVRGDTVESVASLFGTTVENIRAINGHSPDKKLKEGDELFVPTVGAVSVN
jgi:LysM repeat protein